MKKEYLIAIDLGGTKILTSVITRKGKIIRRVKMPTNAQNGKTVLIKRIVESIDQVITESALPLDKIEAVVLGVPGSVNPFTGIIGTAPNLQIKNFNIKNALQKKITLPVLIENDVNLATLGIQRFGYAKNADNALVVFIGTGIGSGLIINKKLYRGSTYFAGEIGHIVVDEKGPICGCGKKGCFEALASRKAVTLAIENEIKKNKRTAIKKIKKKGEPIKSRTLAKAVAMGDTLVIKHVSQACNTIGRVLAGVNNVLNFDMIVLGGGMVEALETFMVPKIKSSFDKHVLKDTTRKLKIVATKLGDDAALYGGVVLVEEFLEK